MAAGDRELLSREIEDSYPFLHGSPANNEAVWKWWEAFLSNKRLRELDLIRLKGLLDAVEAVYKENWKEELK